MRLICDDLEAEHASLDALVSGLEPARWDTPTPAEGWTVRDQIAHLAYSDVSARLAVVDAEAWEREFKIDRAERERRQHDVGWSRTPAELLAWWRECRRAMLAAFRPLDRRARIPWFGPPMSALTFATARLEETWGHGQDVADVRGVRRADTDRLRHVGIREVSDLVAHGPALGGGGRVPTRGLEAGHERVERLVLGLEVVADPAHDYFKA